MEPQEFVDAGDRVATRLRHHGRGKLSGAEIDEELYHQVATFRDGWIVRLEYFGEWSEALEAAGLQEYDSHRSSSLTMPARAIGDDFLDFGQSLVSAEAAIHEEAYEMTEHEVASREAWHAARRALLRAR